MWPAISGKWFEVFIALMIITVFVVESRNTLAYLDHFIPCLSLLPRYAHPFHIIPYKARLRLQRSDNFIRPLQLVIRFSIMGKSRTEEMRTFTHFDLHEIEVLRAPFSWKRLSATTQI
jgi:hypothetical protein